MKMNQLLSFVKNKLKLQKNDFWKFAVSGAFNFKFFFTFTFIISSI